jgi:CRP-like cAMP-binding protein
MTSIGYGDIIPLNNWERLISLGVMIIGSSTYAALFGAATSIYERMNASTISHERKIETIKEFVSSRAIPKEFRDRIIRYYALLWQRTGGLNEQQILKGLSPVLRTEAATHRYRELISSVKLFSMFEPAFVSGIAKQLVPQICLPDDLLVRVGEIGREMYFIEKGSLEVLSANHAVLCLLGRGGYFGEIALFKNRKRTANVRATTVCNLAMLTDEAFDELMRLFPDHALTLRRIAEIRSEQSEFHKDEELVMQTVTSMAAADLNRLTEEVDVLNRTFKQGASNEIQHNEAKAYQKRAASMLSRMSILTQSHEVQTNPASSPVTTPHPLRMSQRRASADSHGSIDINALGDFLGTSSIRRLSSQFNSLSERLSLFKIFNKLSRLVWWCLPSLDFHLHSESLFMFIWNVTVSFVILYYLITIPFTICFLHRFSAVVDGIVYLILLIDMPIRFAQTYESEFGTEDDSKRLFNHYIRSSFLVDYAAMLPLEWLYLASRNSSEENIDPVTYGVLSCVRLLRVPQLRDELYKIDSKLQMIGPGVFKIFIRFGMFLVFNHYVACFFFLFGRLDFSDHDALSWLEKLEDHHPAYMERNSTTKWGPRVGHTRWGMSSGYVNSFYWACVTTGTVAYGDIIPSRQAERVYGIVVMIIAKVFIAFLYADTSQLMRSHNGSIVKFRAKIRMLHDYVVQHNLPGTLRDRLHQHYMAMWDHTKGTDEMEIVNDLPVPLGTDLLLYLYRDLITKVPMFQHDEGLVFTIVRMLELRFIGEGSNIVTVGEVGEEMYFISSGTAEVVLASGDTVGVLQAGSFFGEMSLIQSGVRKASVRTVNDCLVCILTKKNFDMIVQAFPEVHSKVIATVNVRVQENQRTETRSIARKASAVAQTPRPLSRRQSLLSNPQAHELEKLNEEDEMSQREKLPLTHRAAVDSTPMETEENDDNTCVVQSDDTMPSAETSKLASNKVLPLTPQAKATGGGKLPILGKVSPGSAKDTPDKQSPAQPAADEDDEEQRKAIEKADALAREKTRKDLLTKFRSRANRINSLRLLLEIPIVLFSTYVWIVTPLQMCFPIEISGWILMMEIGALVVFWLDILLQLIVHLNSHPLRKIELVQNGSRCVFCPSLVTMSDIVSALPITWLCNEAGWNTARPHDLWPLIWAVQTLRMFRYYKITLLFSALKSKRQINASAIRLIEILINYLVWAHYLCCMWIKLGFAEDPGHHQNGEFTPSDDVASWFQRLPVPTFEGRVPNMPPLSYTSIYIHSLQFHIVTISHVGLGDVVGVTLIERIWGAVLICLGTFSYALLFSNITTYVAAAASSESGFHEICSGIMDYIRLHKLEQNLKMKVQMYLTYMTTRFCGLRDEDILADIPLDLRTDILMVRYQSMIEKVNLFHKKEVGFIRSVVSRLYTRVFLPGDLAMKAGILVNEMHFLLEGTAYVLSEHTHDILAELHDGSVYGELGLLRRQCSITSIAAKTICWVGVLSQEDLDTVLRCHEQSSEDILAAIRKHDEPNHGEAESSVLMQDPTASSEFYKSGPRTTKSSEPEITARRLLHPQSMARFGWECFHFMCALWTVLVIPYEIASGLHVKDAWLVIDLIVDLMYFVDIFNRCRTAIIQRGILITARHVIALKYMRSWGFVFDLITALPVAQLQLALGAFDDSPNIYACLRAIKVYRLWRIVKFTIDPCNTMFVSERIIKVMYPVLYLALIWHYCACLWWFTARATDGWERNWLKVYGWNEAKPSEKFFISYYYSLVVPTTVGYGDIWPTNDAERVYTIGLMLVGDVGFAMCFAHVAEMSKSSNRWNVRAEEKRISTMEFLRFHRAPAKIVNRVMRHFYFMWRYYRRAGSDYQDIKLLAQELPLSLRSEIIEHLNRPMLNTSPLFGMLDYHSRMMVCEMLTAQVFLPDDVVIQSGEIGDEMFFIAKGEVTALADDGRKIAKHQVGDFFGELALLHTERSPCSYKARSFCELYVLSKTSMEMLFKHVPSLANHISGTAKRRQAALSKSIFRFVEPAAEFDGTYSATPTGSLGGYSPQQTGPVRRLSSSNRNSASHKQETHWEIEDEENEIGESLGRLAVNGRQSFDTNSINELRVPGTLESDVDSASGVETRSMNFTD